MKIYLKQNVLEAAKERINYLFDEFEEVCVGFSGGKDSCVVLNLTLEVAAERGRLPIKVMYIDQEAEWENVTSYVRTVMDDPRVDPYWFQMPIKIFNSTSFDEDWLWCWEEGKEDEWIRPKQPDAIKENIFGTMRFGELFNAILKHYFKDKKTCYIAGVRAEESPSRWVGLTGNATYQDITWGKQLDGKIGNHFTFYPLYDWSYTDIWKVIFENNWSYCKIYDYMYQRGVPVMEMRVSNLHHETAVKNLYYLQEIEPNTWNALVKRLKGVHSVRDINHRDMFSIKELPFMFNDWHEYRDHLIKHLVSDQHKETYIKKFKEMDKIYEGALDNNQIVKTQINTIMANDFHFTKLNNMNAGQYAREFRKWKQGKPINNRFSKWILQNA